MISTFFLGFFALCAFLSALGMLFLRHPMRVALALISAMLSLASLFALLENHVLAVFQVLIYVGAIMVFMVYVIMLLDSKDHSLLKRFSSYLIPASLLLILGIIFLAPKLSLPQGPAIFTPVTVAAFSKEFLQEYFFYFELSSVLLIVAVVASITIIKGRSHDH